MVAPIITAALDDVSPQTGAVPYGGYSNDTAPVIRVSLGDQAAAGEILTLANNGTALCPPVTLTDGQVAQGYADVPVAGLAEGWNLIGATLSAADGALIATTPSFALGIATATPAAPAITGATDDAGAATGAVADGGHTDDTTPKLEIVEPGLPPPPTGSPGHAPYGGPPLLSGHVQLYDGDQLVGDAVIGFGGAVTITTGELAPGEHVLTAVAVDRAGNVSAVSSPFTLVVDAAASGPSGGDLLQAAPEDLEVHGGDGADTITGTDAADVLRGGAGDDLITGGSQFNSINGNAGADTIHGRSAVGDWLLGGQGDDLIDAGQSSGRNLMNGNQGSDSLQAGAGGDTVRGGQGDDVLVGGAGNDWLSGDLGADTLTGGAGADVFHAFAGAGIDRVTDFDPGQGDRVLIDPGVAYTASQAGADTVIEVGGQGRMILAGVSLSSLGNGWLLQA